VTELPILMTGAMVRASMRPVDPKGQTRRLLYVPTKSKNSCFDNRYPPPFWPETLLLPTLSKWRKCKTGDRLWVRETSAQNENQLSDDHMDRSYVYRADGEQRALDNGCEKPWKPAIHMPRAACRLRLELTADARIERLQAISTEDAIAEGVRPEKHVIPEDDTAGFRAVAAGHSYRANSFPIARYAVLWDSINGESAPWASDPWVVVLTFKRIEGIAA
jgi:hypothetical protein